MNAIEHRARAEALLEDVEKSLAALEDAAEQGVMVPVARIEAINRALDRNVARAQVHATLAAGS